MTDPSPTSTPQTIDGHSVRRRIGHGPSGVFYEVEWDGRPAALKLLHDPLPGGPRARARFEIDVGDFAAIRRERALHPLGTGADNDRPYVVYAIAPGRSLAEIMADGSVGDAAHVCSEVVEIARMLADLHEAGLVHRNLKPTNLHVRDDGTWILVDPGIHLAAGAPADHGPWGSREVREGRRDEIDGRADVYSLGKILGAVLGDTAPAEVVSVLELCCRNRPEKRYQTTRLIARGLRAVHQQ